MMYSVRFSLLGNDDENNKSMLYYSASLAP